MKKLREQTLRPPSRDMDQFVLRMPTGMRDRVKQAADASRRSMNAELVRYVEQGLQTAQQPQGAQP